MYSVNSPELSERHQSVLSPELATESVKWKELNWYTV